jgi:MYXO-CTERM domain-containing protein
VRRLAVAVAACSLVAAAPAAAARSLLHVGDSLAVGSDPPLRALLPGWSVTTDALKNRPTATGVAIIDRHAPLPAALVVELGTNDSPDASARFGSYVRHVVALAGPKRCVVWVNIHRPPYNGVSYAGFNRVLEQVAAASPNLAVVDWNGMVESGRATVAGDGVHATPDGYRARAAAIAESLSGCSSTVGPAPGATGSHTLGAPRPKNKPRPRQAPKRRPKPKPKAKPKAIKVYTPKPGAAGPQAVAKPAAAHSSADGTSTGTYFLIGLGLMALLGAGGYALHRRS